MYLLLWTAAWSMLALHNLSAALQPRLVVSPWEQALAHWLLAASGLRAYHSALPPDAPDEHQICSHSGTLQEQSCSVGERCMDPSVI